MNMVSGNTGAASLDSLGYASATERVGARVLAGAAIVFGGLGLIVIAGCFLVGVLSIVQPQVFFGPFTPAGASLSPAQTTLMVVLYLMAFASAAGGVTMIVIGSRGLLRVMRV
jgi:hypothetical protein